MTAACTVCAGPYTRVDDDPSPAHPGCAPVDPRAYDRVRRYSGRMRAIWWSVCAGCDRRINEGDWQVLADTVVGRRWVCEPCGQRARPESAHTVATAPTPDGATPTGHGDRSGPHSARTSPIRADSTTDELRRTA